MTCSDVCSWAWAATGERAQARTMAGRARRIMVSCVSGYKHLGQSRTPVQRLFRQGRRRNKIKCFTCPSGSAFLDHRAVANGNCIHFQFHAATSEEILQNLTIRKLRARAVNVPLAKPHQTAGGTVVSAPLVLIDLETDQGVTGRTYL